VKKVEHSPACVTQSPLSSFLILNSNLIVSALFSITVSHF
jgi:hypothetical protein